MEPYTRENICSSMLKTVIMRIDFEGLTDLPSFISRIKSKDKMQEAFKKMAMLPKQNMKVSFRPKSLNEGLLPITESQKSTLYRFYKCTFGGSSEATLDIEFDSITLAVNCQENYQGSKDYSDFMGWIINELCAYDPYIVMKRLGVRKIDVQVLSEGEDINSYFNENYVVAQSWKNSPPKTQSVLTELLEQDNILFNVVQHIDRTSDNRIRLIYDIDAFLNKDEIESVRKSREIEDILYHDIQDRMFNLFINVVNNKYLESIKKK